MNDNRNFPPLHPILGSFAHDLNFTLLFDPNYYPQTNRHTLKEHRHNPNLPYLRHSPSILSIVRHTIGPRSLFGLVSFSQDTSNEPNRRSCTSIAAESACTQGEWVIVDPED